MPPYYHLAHLHSERPEPATDKTFEEWARYRTWWLEAAICLVLGYVPRSHLEAEPHPKYGEELDDLETWYGLYRTRIRPLLELYACYASDLTPDFEPYRVRVTPRRFLTFCKRCGVAIPAALKKCIYGSPATADNERDPQRRSPAGSVRLEAVAAVLRSLEPGRRVTQKELWRLALRRLPGLEGCQRTFERDLEKWCASGSDISPDTLQLLVTHCPSVSRARTRKQRAASRRDVMQDELGSQREQLSSPLQKSKHDTTRHSTTKVVKSTD